MSGEDDMQTRRIFGGCNWAVEDGGRGGGRGEAAGNTITFDSEWGLMAERSVGMAASVPAPVLR